MGVTSNIIKTLGVVTASEIVYFLYKKFRTKSADKRKSEHELARWLKKTFNQIDSDKHFYLVLFFPDPGMTCARNMAGRTCRNPKCVAVHEFTNLATLVKMIEMAEHSIDVCVYLFSSNILGDALAKRQEDDVDVCVITDARNSGEAPDISAAGAQMGKLRAAGAAVVCHESSFWMHHKFMIIDNEVVVTGSLNWTNSGAMGNFENIVISNNPKIVQPYIKEFNRLWALHQPDLM